MEIGFLLSKVIPQLVYPIGFSCVLLVIAALLVLIRWRLPALLSIVAALAVLLTASSPELSDRLLASLESQFPPVSVYDTPTADAIVYLGGGLSGIWPPRLSAELIGSSDRLLHTARLYRAGRAPVVIVCGGSVWPQSEGMTEAQAARDLLIEWGVDETAIILEEQSRTTYQNALYSQEILHAKNYRQVLLVTSASHMRRALATFRSLGIEALAAPTDYVVTRTDDPTPLRWFPQANAVDKSERAIKEYIGYRVYQWRGWITATGSESVAQEIALNLSNGD